MSHAPPFSGRSLSFERFEGTLEVRLHQAPLNEIGVGMLEELEALAALIRVGDPEIRAILIHSEMPGGFSAGADLRALHRGLSALREGRREDGALSQARSLFDGPRTASRAALGTLKVSLGTRPPSPLILAKRLGVRAFLERIHRVFDTLDRAPVPVVAAVHGVCFGGGFELALTADLIVADRTARFAFPELRLGLIPGFGGIPRLNRDLGNGLVRELLLSGRSLGAKRALEVGLVGQLVGAGQAPTIARRLAEQLGRFDARTARIAKRFVKPFPRRALEREKDLFCALLASDEVEAALARFVKDQGAMPYLPARKAHG